MIIRNFDHDIIYSISIRESMRFRFAINIKDFDAEYAVNFTSDHAFELVVVISAHVLGDKIDVTYSLILVSV